MKKRRCENNLAASQAIAQDETPNTSYRETNQNGQVFKKCIHCGQLNNTRSMARHIRQAHIKRKSCDNNLNTQAVRQSRRKVGQ